MSEFLRFEKSDGIGWLTIDRPQKKNAMTYAMLGDFIELVGEAGRDPETRVLVVTGVPGAFCAGTDLADLETVPGKERGLRGSAREKSRWWPIVACEKPVIAAVDGPAVGMGAEFATQCDLRIATPNARFAWNFAHRGLVPDTGAGSWILPRLLGPARALKLLYTGDFLTAEQAHALGFVEDVVEPEALPAAARDLALRIAAVSPFSTARIKRLVYEGLAGELDGHMERHTKAMAECFASDDHQEGVRSFLERRPPAFTGT
jgi:enoyl-CoA hydratase/carnithine racemase